jgi:formamidopyrimidine-DNA glycosylase
MPELPDITIYIEALRRHAGGANLEEIRILDPFVLRSVVPSAEGFRGRELVDVSRLGKRIVLRFEGDLHAVIHLMIAGRLRWRDRTTKPPGRNALFGFFFSTGTLVLTEAGSKHRASLHLIEGEAGLIDHDRGGLEVFDADLDDFCAAITNERHTLKRTLTDPRILSGIGNAYSDEILHRSRLSPFRLSDGLSDEEITRFFEAVVAVLGDWTERLREEVGDGFPTKVTAFREEMAVHGRFGKPCPDCGAPVQRIRYAESECNYCAGCQTGGRIFADRSLSRLLKADWPKTLDDLDRRSKIEEPQRHRDTEETER